MLSIILRDTSNVLATQTVPFTTPYLHFHSLIYILITVNAKKQILTALRQFGTLHLVDTEQTKVRNELSTKRDRWQWNNGGKSDWPRIKGMEGLISSRAR